MTIFDVIRYPMSYPPTEEELNALPDNLYEYIFEETKERLTPYFLHTILVMHHSNGCEYFSIRMRRIRQKIQEYK